MALFDHDKASRRRRRPWFEMRSRLSFQILFTIFAIIAWLPIVATLVYALVTQTWSLLFVAPIAGFLWLGIVFWIVNSLFANSRVRYFINHTIGRIQSAEATNNNAESYRAVLSVRDFLFSLQRTGHLFRRRWQQSLVLHIADQVVHHVVQECEGALPPVRDLLDEFYRVMRSMQLSQYVPSLTDEDVAAMMNRLLSFYASCPDHAHTFYPMGELAAALPSGLRTTIFPPDSTNEHEDLGLVVDCLFDLTRLLEQLFRDHRELASPVRLDGLSHRKTMGYEVFAVEHPVAFRVRERSIELMMGWAGGGGGQQSQ